MVSCPNCKSKNLRSCALFEGPGVWCPICDKTFVLRQLKNLEEKK